MTAPAPIAADARASTLWIMLLTLAATATTLVLACATPFTALAALAATAMRRRDGIALMVAAWAASQLVGFCVLDYPRDPKTIAWGVALGTSAVAALLGARGGLRLVARRGAAIRLAVAYVTATVAFKAVLAVWATGLGGIAVTLSPSLNATQFVRNGAILLALLLLYRGLVRLGVPAPAPALGSPSTSGAAAA